MLNNAAMLKNYPCAFRPKTIPNQIGGNGKPPQPIQPTSLFQQVMQDVLEDFVTAAAKSEKGLQGQIGQVKSSLTRGIKKALQRQRKRTQQTFKNKLKKIMKRMRQKFSKMIGNRVKKVVEAQMKKLQKSLKSQNKTNRSYKTGDQPETEEEPPRTREQASYGTEASQESSQSLSYVELRQLQVLRNQEGTVEEQRQR